MYRTLYRALGAVLCLKYLLTAIYSDEFYLSCIQFYTELTVLTGIFKVIWEYTDEREAILHSSDFQPESNSDYTYPVIDEKFN